MDSFTIFLAGDLMTGRGIDQIQPHPSNPKLHESSVRDAQAYVRLAEHMNGPLPTRVPAAYIWGDALAEINRRQPDLRVVNLETAICRADAAWPDKGVHYRMNPDNIGCLTVAGLHCCALANNHVMDWGGSGLLETVDALKQAGVAAPGAGSNRDAACAAAALPLAHGKRLLVFSCASSDSGVPHAWGAMPSRAGIALLPDLGEASAQALAARVAEQRKPGDLVMVSLHWGSNWGMAVPQDHRRFAQRLIELGAADLIHAHSSHHPRPIEVFRGRLILYGCGDLINDYEGIERREAFDPSLVCLYFARLSSKTGQLQQLDIVPMMPRRFQLTRPNLGARYRLQSLLEAGCKSFSTGIRLQDDGSWQLTW